MVHFAWLFYNQTVFQNFERSFFDQVAIDAKNVFHLAFEKSPLVAELKLKMFHTEQFFMFSISALPPEYCSVDAHRDTQPCLMGLVDVGCLLSAVKHSLLI